jgi:hypothetical protein
MEPNQISDSLTAGKTYQLPKSENTKELKSHRPDTYLSTVYIMLTRIIARRILSHLEEFSFFTSRVKGMSLWK